MAGNPVTALLSLLGTGINLNALDKEQMARDAEAADNEKIALQAAADSIARGNQEAARARMLATQTIARQKVAFAASGVDASVGTPADAGAGTRMMSELDAQTLKNNAAREAWGFKTQSHKIAKQNYYDRVRTNNQETGSILTGLGSAAGGYSED